MATGDSFKFKVGFKYKPTSRYATHTDLTVVEMDKVSAFCGVINWVGETPGLCCSRRMFDFKH